MSVIRWKSFAAVRGASLCATCVWGTVRKGYRGGQTETFCRMVSPKRPGSLSRARVHGLRRPSRARRAVGS